MLLEFIAKMQLPDRYMYMYMYVHVCTKLVETLCRDGADMPIVVCTYKSLLNLWTLMFQAFLGMYMYIYIYPIPVNLG